MSDPKNIYGLDAVFYDRKNKCEVRSSQLCEILLTEPLVGCDPDEPPEKFEFKPPEEDYGIPSLWISHNTIGEYGYKSPDCPKSRNWDRYMMLHDLVFLRFEELPEPAPSLLRDGLRDVAEGNTRPLSLDSLAPDEEE